MPSKRSTRDEIKIHQDANRQVDDFGTGYSSLQHLNYLPISTLKIDCSFIQQLSVASHSYPGVQAIIAMEHSLQMQIIAEGVEHEDQMKILRYLNCDCIQGFLSRILRHLTTSQIS